MEEGYVKFNCEWIKSEPEPDELIKDLNEWRGIMYENGFIGMYPNGIGYGNISIRLPGGTFVISGTTTGGFRKLDASHYVKVLNYDPGKNHLTCKGPVKASSESMTHAMVYECSSATEAVIHVHDITLWKKLLYNVPTTSEKIPYGTPEMAMEIKKLFAETNVDKERIIVMAGHTEGIISFGRTLSEAGIRLINLKRQL